MADDHSCPSCGARVPADTDQCELCGTRIPTAPDSPEEAPSGTDASGSEGASADAPAEPDAGAPESDGVYCHQCGHENPAAANFCSQCGTELEDLAGTATPEGTRAVAADLPEGEDGTSAPAASGEEAEPSQARMGKQLAWMVGVGLVLVLGFFGITQWSQQYEWGSETDEASAAASQGGAAQGQRPAAQGGAAAPERPSNSQGMTSEPTALPALVEELSDTLDGPVAGQVDSLRALEAEATGQEQQRLQSELVRLYIGAGAPGRAALVQQKLADAAGTVEARRRAADLLYQWMREVERTTGRARVSDVARHVASEYEGVVQKRPENLDARTRMGEAYLLTNNPMKGIQAINGVLKDDSTFVPARFQKGLALLQINRVDQAVQEFKRVKAHADPQNPFYKQAERAIEVINEKTSTQGSGAEGTGAESGGGA